MKVKREQSVNEEAKLQRKLNFLESACQGTFDLSRECKEGMNLFDGESGPWHLKINYGDENLRKYFYLLALVEFLNALVKEKHYNEWYVFGHLDIEAITQVVLETDDFVKIKATTDIGCVFIEIIKMVNILKSCFRHYNLHPYAELLLSDECSAIADTYNNQFNISREMFSLSSLEIKDDIVAYCIERVKPCAEKIDISFIRIIKQLDDAEFKRRVRDFENKAKNNFSKLNDFSDRMCVDDHVTRVVIKASLNFIEDSSSRHSKEKAQSNADHFGEVITKFNDKMRRNVTSKYFVELFQILKAPSYFTWSCECYFVLSFPKNGPAFNSDFLAFLEEKDKEIMSGIRFMLYKKTSTDYNEIAKKLNEIIGNGKSLDELIVDIFDSVNIVQKNKNKKDKNKSDETKIAHQTRKITSHEFRQTLINFEVNSFMSSINALWLRIMKVAVKKTLIINKIIMKSKENMKSIKNVKHEKMMRVSDLSLRGIVQCERASIRRLMPELAFSEHKKTPNVNSHSIRNVSSHEEDSNKSKKFDSNNLQKLKYRFMKNQYGLKPYSNTHNLNGFVNANEFEQCASPPKNMIVNLCEVSMASLFFMTLNLSGKSKELDEIRYVHVHVQDLKK